MADIGLQGTKTKVAGKVVDAVTIFVGGKSGKGARLAEKILEDVPCDCRASWTLLAVRELRSIRWQLSSPFILVFSLRPYPSAIRPL